VPTKAVSEIESVVRERLSVDGSDYRIRVSEPPVERTVSSLKEAQVLLWNDYCDARRPSDDEREKVKVAIFDQVARRVAIANLAGVWGLGER